MLDPQRIRQVFVNLLSNAIAYTPAGGQLFIRYTAVSHQDEPTVGIEVQNNGPSILPTDLPHLFERFYRGENALATKAHGTGLGLAICKQIVERHGGSITIHSGEIEGTVVSVFLPLSQNGN